MFSAYNVAVKLTLVNNVTAGLNAINSQLHRLNNGFKNSHGHVSKFAAGITNLQKQVQMVQGALVGGGMVRAGFGMVGMFKGPIDEAKELQKQISNLNVLGMKQAEIQEVINTAYRTSREVITTKSADNIVAYRELRSVFGAGHEHEALSILPQVQKIGSVLEAVTGRKQEGVGFDLVKGLEMTVKGPMSEGLLRRRMDLAEKSMIGMGGTIDAHDMHMALKYAKTGAMSYSEDFLFNYLPTLIQEFKTGKHGGASSAGTVLNAGYRMIVGQQIAKDTFQNWLDAGLIDPSKVVANKHHTGAAKLNPGAVIDAALYGEHPYQYMNTVMLPGIQKLMATKHITQEQAVNALTKDGNKAFLINTLINKAQQFERDKKMIEGANSKESYDKLIKENPQLADMALQKQWQELQAQIGFQILPDVLKGMQYLIDKIKDLSKWARENGDHVRSMVKTWIGIGAAIAGFGAVAFVATGLVAIKTAFLELGGPKVLGLARTGLTLLGRGILFVGRALLMNPIGLVITGIAVAAYLLYKNWDTVKPKLEAAWKFIKDGFSSFVDGIVSLWHKLKSYLPSWLGGGSSAPAPVPAQPQSYMPPSSAAGGSKPHGDVYLDSRKVGHVMWPELAKTMTRQPTGPRAVDPTSGLFPVSASLGY